ncbi:hypothetical protein J3459_011819 [Metarhizium acridum]|nr:hypothetical protein J3459_011819 [Metarhizium acridum]
MESSPLGISADFVLIRKRPIVRKSAASSAPSDSVKWTSYAAQRMGRNAEPLSYCQRVCVSRIICQRLLGLFFYKLLMTLQRNLEENFVVFWRRDVGPRLEEFMRSSPDQLAFAARKEKVQL